MSKEIRAAILELLGPIRTDRLLAQVGGGEAFEYRLASASIAAAQRHFDRIDQAAAFGVIALVRRCCSKPTPEDIARYMEAAAAPSPHPPITKPKKSAKK